MFRFFAESTTGIGIGIDMGIDMGIGVAGAMHCGLLAIR